MSYGRRRCGAWRSLVSALVWGTKGRRFESGRPDSLDLWDLQGKAWLAEVPPVAERPPQYTINTHTGCAQKVPICRDLYVDPYKHVFTMDGSSYAVSSTK